MEVQSSSFETGTEAKSSGGVESTLMGTKPVSAEDGPRAHTPIDPFSEELLTLAQAAALCPKVNGKRPRCSTIWRWCKKGSHGATLGHVRIGSRIMTSRTALLAFFDRSQAHKRVGNSTGSDKSPVRSDKRRERELERAWQRLKQHGL